MGDSDVYEGGYYTYGAGIGVLGLDTTFPRPPGDIGNARTFDYPVFYEVVEGADPVRVVREQDPELIKPFVEAAQQLVDKGAVAITTSCGFMLNFQDEMANQIEVPVFTSSLLQIPLIKSMLGDDEKIGIVSADEKNLRQIEHPVMREHEESIVMEGVSESDEFQEVIIEMTSNELDKESVGEDVTNAARRLKERGDIGAVLFECTNLRPYVEEVQDSVDLPVFDYLTLSDMAWRAAKGTRY